MTSKQHKIEIDDGNIIEIQHQIDVLSNQKEEEKQDNQIPVVMFDSPQQQQREEEKVEDIDEEEEQQEEEEEEWVLCSNNDNANNNAKKLLSFFDSVCVLTTFATAGSIVAIPWAISQLGYILGPILLIAVALMNLFFFNFLIDVADNNSTTQTTDCCIRTLGDVGDALGGSKGRILFDTFQMGNLILYMPVALETVGLSLQYLVDGSCIGYWNIVSFAVLFVMIQFMNCWTNVAWLSYVTVSVAAIKAFILLPYSFVLYQDDIIVNSTTDYLGSSVQPIGNPNPTWNSIALACSTFAFALAPVFILLEVRSDMKTPSQCKKALKVSFVVQVTMYLVPALVCVSLWGWNISSPITIEIPRGILGILMSLVVLLAVALDYCIAAKVINDWLEQQFFPKWLKTWQTQKQNEDEESSSGGGGSNFSSPRLLFLLKQLMYKILYSLPTSIFSLGFVLAIPNFETLIGVVTGITIIGISNWAITLAWSMGGGGGGCANNKQFQTTTTNRILMWFGGVVGFAFTIWVVAAAIEEIVTTDYSSGFFCSGS